MHSWNLSCLIRWFQRAVMLFLIGSSFFFSGMHLSYAQTSSSEGVEGVAEQWVNAFNKGDAGSIAGLYAPEAQMIPPNGQYIDGKDIDTYWHQRLSVVPGKLSIEKSRIEASGELAYQTGIFQLILPDGLQTRGHILSVLCRKKAEGWRICVQTWSISPELWDN